MSGFVLPRSHEARAARQHVEVAIRIYGHDTDTAWIAVYVTPAAARTMAADILRAADEAERWGERAKDGSA